MTALPDAGGYHATGTIHVFGAAAAVGRLLGKGKDDDRLRKNLDAIRRRAASAGMIPEVALLDSLIGDRRSR